MPATWRETPRSVTNIPTKIGGTEDSHRQMRLLRSSRITASRLRSPSLWLILAAMLEPRVMAISGYTLMVLMA